MSAIAGPSSSGALVSFEDTPFSKIAFEAVVIEVMPSRDCQKDVFILQGFQEKTEITSLQTLIACLKPMSLSSYKFDRSHNLAFDITAQLLIDLERIIPTLESLAETFSTIPTAEKFLALFKMPSVETEKPESKAKVEAILANAFLIQPTKLSLTGLSLTKCPNLSDDFFPHLRELDLSDNKLKMIALSDLPSRLATLNLQENPHLTDLAPAFLSHFAASRTLMLDV